MDEELFDGSASPYSAFRDVIGFFENRSCPARFKFRFMSGTLKDEIDDSVTHVFVEDNKTGAAAGERLRMNERRTCVRIVKCRWIEECFEEMVARYPGLAESADRSISGVIARL
jgi:hypothetical protein